MNLKLRLVDDWNSADAHDRRLVALGLAWLTALPILALLVVS